MVQIITFNRRRTLDWNNFGCHPAFTETEETFIARVNEEINDIIPNADDIISITPITDNNKEVYSIFVAFKQRSL